MSNQLCQVNLAPTSLVCLKIAADPDLSLASAPSVHDFVIVSVEGKQRSVQFYAKVLEIDEDELKVHYLVKKPASDIFVWSDTAWVSTKDVVRTVPAPSLVPGRGIGFMFQ